MSMGNRYYKLPDTSTAPAVIAVDDQGRRSRYQALPDSYPGAEHQRSRDDADYQGRHNRQAHDQPSGQHDAADRFHIPHPDPDHGKRSTKHRMRNDWRQCAGQCPRLYSSISRSRIVFAVVELHSFLIARFPACGKARAYGFRTNAKKWSDVWMSI